MASGLALRMREPTRMVTHTKSAIVSSSRSGRIRSSTTAGSFATTMNAFGGQLSPQAVTVEGTG